MEPLDTQPASGEVPPAPGGALTTLAAELRGEGPLISAHVAEPEAEPALGELTAAGSRCAATPAAYSTVVESVREGYLLHYGEPRLLAGLDPDLRLLAGDHLYARGIERLVELDDLPAVRELSDLISIVAQLHATGEGAAPAGRSSGSPPASRSGPDPATPTTGARQPCAPAETRGRCGRLRLRPPIARPSRIRWPKPVRQ